MPLLVGGLYRPRLAERAPARVVVGVLLPEPLAAAPALVPVLPELSLPGPGLAVPGWPEVVPGLEPDGVQPVPIQAPGLLDVEPEQGLAAPELVWERVVPVPELAPEAERTVLGAVAVQTVPEAVAAQKFVVGAAAAV